MALSRDEAVAVFKAAWLAADARGESGHRTEGGIDAVFERLNGVTLTPEEAARVLLWWAVYREEGFPGMTDAALVARLEQA